MSATLIDPATNPPALLVRPVRLVGENDITIVAGGSRDASSLWVGPVTLALGTIPLVPSPGPALRIGLASVALAKQNGGFEATIGASALFGIPLDLSGASSETVSIAMAGVPFWLPVNTALVIIVTQIPPGSNRISVGYFIAP